MMSKSISNRPTSNRSTSNRSISNRSISNRSIAHKTVDVSLWVQVITGVLSVAGLTYELAPQHGILKAILLMETLVQLVEFLAYAYLLRGIPLQHMARVRYYDWFLTTPTMLLTTIAYMSYTRAKEVRDLNLNLLGKVNTQAQAQAQAQAQDEAQDEAQPNMQFLRFLSDNRGNIALIFLSNVAMLACGFLRELGLLDTLSAFAFGFLAFGVTFSTIWHAYARHSSTGRALFVFLVTVWGAYGVVFLLPDTQKNTAYNFLDIVAKNFFGIYLFFTIKRAAEQQVNQRALDG